MHERGTWKIVNEVLNSYNKKAHLPDTFIIGDNTVSNKQDIANSFNNWAPSLAAKLYSATLSSNYLGDSNPSSLFLFPATEDKVERLLLIL